MLLLCNICNIDHRSLPSYALAVEIERLSGCVSFEPKSRRNSGWTDDGLAVVVADKDEEKLNIPPFENDGELTSVFVESDLAPSRSQCYKTFLSVVYEFLYQARVFVRIVWKSLPRTNTLVYCENL
jgi:hypothetical protein